LTAPLFYQNQNNMRLRILFLSLAISLTFGVLNAQIKIEADTVFTAITAHPDIKAHNVFTNQIPQQKVFKWTRNIVEMTDGWDCAICDQNQCYIPVVSEMEITVGPNATSLLDVHIYPNEIYSGYAFVEMNIAYADDASVNKVAYYLFDSRLSSTQNLEQFEIEVYPNPSAGLFNVKDPKQVIHSIRVFDLVGKQLMNIAKGDRQWIELARLQTGKYWIQLMDKNGSPLGTKMVSKI